MKRYSASDFLQLAFVPDREEAVSYLEKTLAAARAVETGETNLKHLLGKIIEDNITASGNDRVGIMLSGGLDSRGILGATLDVVGSEKITCVTYGAKTFPDVIKASQICKKLGVKHHIIDLDTVPCDLDQLNEISTRSDQIKILDSLRIKQAVLPFFENGQCIMHGYLGDSLTGSHLPKQNPNNRNEVIGHFLEKNDGFKMQLASKPAMIAFFDQFLDEVIHKIPAWPGISNYDILDLAWRQGLRIRPVKEYTKPYEDPRWVAFWYQNELINRKNQTKYKSFLASSYPQLFPDLINRFYTPDILFKKFYRKVSSLNKRKKTPNVLIGRGDPRRNPSLKKAYDTLARVFDDSDIVQGWSAQKDLAQLIINPNKVNIKKLKLALTTAFHIRYGRLDHKRPSVFENTQLFVKS